MTDAPALGARSGTGPIVLPGEKAEADAAGKGVIRATGTLSVDKNCVVLLDAEKVETGIKLGAAQLAEDAIEAAGGSLERGEAPSGPVTGITLASDKVTDTALGHLKHFPKIERLDLPGSRVADAGLEAIKGLADLQYLTLTNAAVTDAGLKHLKGLAKLKSVSLGKTKVMADGAADLQKALPKMKAYR